jgi:hypothetical protein
MVLVAPAMAVNWMHARRDARADYGSSAIGVLNQAMAQARSELRLASGGRYAVVILLLCAAVVWVLHLFSLETRRDAALLSAVWAGTALLAWIRLRQRERVLRAELESYEHHAQELGRDET